MQGDGMDRLAKTGETQMQTIEPKPYNHAKWSAGRQVFITAVMLVFGLCVVLPILAVMVF